MADDEKAKSTDRPDDSDPVRSLREAYKQADELQTQQNGWKLLGLALWLLFVAGAGMMWGVAVAVCVALIAIPLLRWFLNFSQKIRADLHPPGWAAGPRTISSEIHGSADSLREGYKLGADGWRPMSIRDILEGTFTLYWRHFLNFVTAAAVVAVPVALLSPGLGMVLNLATEQDGVLTPQAVAVSVVGAVSIGILSMLGTLLGEAATVWLTSDAVLGEAVKVSGAYRVALGRLLSLLWALILSTLALILLCVTIVGISVAVYWALGWSVSLLTIVLCVTIVGIPVAVYWALGWSVSTQAIVIEGLGGCAGLRRSSELVGGHRWRLLGRSVLISILIAVLMFILTTVLTWPLSAAVDVGVDPDVVAFVALPFSVSLSVYLFWIAWTLVYYDLRVRKEAFYLPTNR